MLSNRRIPALQNVVKRFISPVTTSYQHVFNMLKHLQKCFATTPLMLLNTVLFLTLGLYSEEQYIVILYIYFGSLIGVDLLRLFYGSSLIKFYTTIRYIDVTDGQTDGRLLTKITVSNRKRATILVTL